MDGRKSGSGHPLPASDEARHGEIPANLADEKGYGDDPVERVSPPSEAAMPDGEIYPSGDEGRAGDIETGAGSEPASGPGTPI